MICGDVQASLRRTFAQQPDVKCAVLTYESGTALRPGFLIVIAPGATDERLTELSDTTRAALGDFVEHVPFVCAADWPEEYRNKGKSFIYGGEPSGA